MPNPQQLKERIYALNPELKALTMGCVVKDKTGEWILIGKYGDDYHCFNGTSTGFIEWSNIEIIGHPIHLEHVLIAIEKSKGTVSIDTIGDWYDDNMHQVGTRYDLTKTFDQNIAENEELVTFLLNIIK